MNKLQVVNSLRPISQKQALLNSLKNTQERLWKSGIYGKPVSFIQKHYFEKIISNLPPSKNRGIDIGCGCGYYSCELFKKGKEIYACDIAENAAIFTSLSLPFDRITCQALPYLQEEDNRYDFALILDVIAELPSNLHRLAISEVARVLKKDGIAFFSTRLERLSFDSLEKFLLLISTEFIVEKVELLHLRYWHLICRIFPRLENADFFERMGKKLAPQSSYSDVLVLAKKKSLF